VRGTGFYRDNNIILFGLTCSLMELYCIKSNGNRREGNYGMGILAKAGCCV
jgi:hypothetical protein